MVFCVRRVSRMAHFPAEEEVEDGTAAGYFDRGQNNDSGWFNSPRSRSEIHQNKLIATRAFPYFDRGQNSDSRRLILPGSRSEIQQNKWLATPSSSYFDRGQNNSLAGIDGLFFIPHDSRSDHPQTCFCRRHNAVSDQHVNRNSRGIRCDELPRQVGSKVLDFAYRQCHIDFPVIGLLGWANACKLMIMANVQEQVQRCPDCHRGMVTLLTTVKPCQRCRGTGFVVDPSLSIPIASLDTSIRLRRFLAKIGITELGQLACAAAAGQIDEWSVLTKVEAKQLIQKHCPQQSL